MNIRVKRKPKNCTMKDIYMRIRRDWGNVNPVTKVIPDKRFKKPKYKGRDWE